MRKYAILKSPVVNIKKVMVYSCDDGVYVFTYDTANDVPAMGDNWFERLDEAEELCKEKYKIQNQDWIIIKDPMEYCQHDIIAPIRVKGRNTGCPQWGNYEQLVDGRWVDIEL